MTTSITRAGVQILILIAVAVLVFALSDPYFLNMAVLALLMAAFCIAWNLSGGFGGVFSFAHTFFVAAGAYAPIFLVDAYEIPFWLAVLLAVLMSCVGAVAVVLMMHYFRLAALQFALATIALAEIVLLVVLGTDALGGASGLSVTEPLRIGPLELVGTEGFFWLALAMVCLFVVLSVWFLNSRFGYYLVAARDNVAAAASVGVPVIATQVRSMVISAVMTCLVGVAYVHYTGFVDPYQVASPAFFIEIVLLATLGGLGTLWGPPLAALLFIPLTEFLRGEFGGSIPGLSQLLFGVLVILVLLALRGGLARVGTSLSRIIPSISPRKARG